MQEDLLIYLVKSLHLKQLMMAKLHSEHLKLRHCKNTPGRFSNIELMT